MTTKDAKMHFQDQGVTYDARYPASWLRRYGYNIWFWQPTRHTLTAEALPNLRRLGWQRLEPEQMILFDCLIGQLADVRQLRMTATAEPEYWVFADDFSYANTYPAALGFLLPTEIEEWLPSHIAAPDSMRPFPPVSLGEVGAVFVNLQYQEVSISDLAVMIPEAQTLRRQLHEELCLLQGEPGDSHGFYRLVASLPNVLEAYRESLRKDQAQEALRLSWWERLNEQWASRRATQGHPRNLENASQKLRVLQEAHQHLLALGHPLTEQARQHQLELLQRHWPQIRGKAHKLAALYYRYAQSTFAQSHLIGVGSHLWTTPVAETKLSPEAWIAARQPCADVLADPISRALVQLLRESPAFVFDTSKGYAHTSMVLQSPIGKATLEVSLKLDRQQWEQRACDLLSEHLLDTWLAIQVILIACKSDHLTEMVELPPKLILETCQRQKESYGYVYQQRLRVLEELKLLSHLQVRCSLPMSQSVMAPPIESPLLSFHIKESEQVFVALGDWVNQMPMQWRATISVPRYLLRLHPKRERRAKRMGFYLVFLFANHPEGVDVDTATLVKQAGILVEPKNPKRTRDRLVRALNLLAGLPVLSEEQRVKNFDEFLVWDSLEQPGIIDQRKQVIVFKALNRDIDIQELGRNFLEDRLLKLRWHFAPGHLLTSPHL